ncbi:MAG: hypothetical protein P1P76_02180 [Anaerolineales bacterium]|nr:hypothetical protein [Anaerolineales bacterium]
MITLFSAPKPFVEEHIARIQTNAIRSWLGLGAGIEVLLLGEEPGLAQAARELNVPLVPVRSRAPSGAPLIDELFGIAREASRHSVLTYLNADIILLDDFLPAVSMVQGRFSEFLIVGNRWDFALHEELEFHEGWQEAMRQRFQEHGRMHPPMGSDYFVYRKGQFADMPPFALGRAGWDNWMMYKARHEGWPLIDASERITVVHQDHDYGHLPGGRPHYRHPESGRNIELAGGYETMFRLCDADWVLGASDLRKKRLTEWSWPRKIEADLISAIGPGNLARLVRMSFHPRDALAYLRQKMFGNRKSHSIGRGDGGVST